MNLKKRIILANASTVIVPLLITALVALALFFVFTRLWSANLSLENYEKLTQIKFELLSMETGILLRTPEIVEEEGFRTHLQEQMAAIQGEFMVVKDGRVTFSSRNFSKIEIAKSLEAGNQREKGEAVQIGEISYTVQGIDLPFKNAATGSLLLLAPVSQGSKHFSTFLTLIGLTFLVAFILTITLVSYQFSRSILKPLHNLQGAAEEISRGNLEQPIVEEGDQELKALCSDLERMRLKLKESVHTQLRYEENRKMLVSSISHDLKTPVTSIRGYVEGILDGVADSPEKLERYLKTIEIKAGQVDQMIDDLLLYAKLDLNQLPFDFERTDLEDYLRQCVAESEPELERDSVKITFANELTERRYVLLDRKRIKRVILNIVDNSRKYMGDGQGEIHVYLRETPVSLVIEFRDNGSGIKEEDLPFIFDRFYRSDAARSQGSGLGLAIAKNIIEGHAGKIWAVSHQEGGTSIMISLRKE